MRAAAYRWSVMLGLVLGSAGIAAADDYLWQGYAQNPQHSALSAVASQPLTDVRWMATVDLDPQYSGGDLLIHYGSPLITAGNMMVVPVKTTASGGFEVQGLVGSTGGVAWTATSDYVVPPNGTWTPPYSPTLTSGGLLYYPGTGGSIYRANLSSADAISPTRLSFYGASIAAPPDSHVYINTPITSDAAGNIYFGYQVFGTPTVAALGAGGIARISADGVGTFVSAAAATGDSAMQKIVSSSAPAVSASGGSIYVTVNSNNNGNGYLLKLDSTTLATQAKVVPNDPKTGGNAPLSDDGTASPTIGPDGDVYMGVFDAGFTSRGWLEHYSANLATTKTPGGFGWDNTASIVPATMVPSYHGTSSYLLMTKYNNYVETGGGGQNMIAILDPNASMIDNQRNNSTGATIMQTVLTKLGPTPNSAGGVYEWCDNDAVVDPATNSVLVTSEDGHLYRWNLATNTLTQTIALGGGLGEAYTPTLIGPDGSVLALNNGILHAIGLPLTTWTGAAGGTWNTTATSWSSGSPAAATTYANGAVVLFADTNPINGQKVPNDGGTVEIVIEPAGVQPAWITFANTGAAAGGIDYRLGGGPIGGATGITVAGNGGVGGLVTLTSANSFTGGVAVVSGRLNLQDAAAVGNSSGVTVAYGAALELQTAGGSPTVFGLTVTGGSPIPLSLAGPGPAGGGAFKSVAGNNTYAGPITIGLASGGATIASSSAAPGDGLALSGGVSVAPGATLTVAGQGGTTISGGPLSLAAATFDGPATLAKQGPGKLEIASAPNLGSGSSIAVAGGTLRFNVTSGAATVGAGVTATVSAGATLELSGSVSALATGPARVNILNDSTAAGVLVTGTNQRIGAVEGSGDLTIAAGGDLTADHILQAALIIGGTPNNPARLTLAATDDAGNPLSVDPSAASDLAVSTSLLPPTSFAANIDDPPNSFADATALQNSSSSVVNSTTVPEPSTLALALASFVVLLFIGRRSVRFFLPLIFLPTICLTEK